jgi:hypothetical protein
LIMSTKPLPLDKPTRRGIDELFRQLTNYHDDSWEACQQLRAEVELLEKKLLDVPAYRKLKAKADAAYRAYHARRARLRKKAGQLRLEYCARGLTPDIKRRINALVKEANRK